ncbi:unnamed protein product [Nezara viridula]|uniref:Uncharacterized protein n=1 Tax=Nezara viridula TaxID=85310 RepID=A0A9P0HUE0_NEZVI|nr:unnamed protein product [Nezara viridula]
MVTVDGKDSRQSGPADLRAERRGVGVALDDALEDAVVAAAPALAALAGHAVAALPKMVVPSSASLSRSGHALHPSARVPGDAVIAALRFYVALFSPTGFARVVVEAEGHGGGHCCEEEQQGVHLDLWELED